MARSRLPGRPLIAVVRATQGDRPAVETGRPAHRPGFPARTVRRALRALPALPAPWRVLGRAPWWLVAGWAAQVVVRWLLFGGHTGPEIMPDEAGYLIAARVLTGGPGADLSGFSLYQGGYALLLVPAFLLGDDPTATYRLIMLTNALVGALAFPLGRALLLRFGVPDGPAAPLAWALALLPATTVYGGEAVADAVLPVVVAAWLLALDRHVRHGTPSAAVWASCLAGFACAAHLRGAVLLLVHCAVLLSLVALGRARRTVLPALGAACGCAAAAWGLNGWVEATLYPYGPKDLTGLLLTRLTGAGGQSWAVSGAAGQMWAMMTGTWGLGALGLVAAVRIAVTRRTGRPDSGPPGSGRTGHPVRQADRILAGVVVAVTLGIAYTSSAALPDEQRVGNHAYGRYLSCVALVHAALGLSVLLRHRPGLRRLVPAGLVLAGGAGWIVLYAGDRLRTSWYYPQDFPEVGLLGGGHGGLRPVVTTVVACTAALLWWALARGGPVRLFAALLSVNLAASWLIVYTRHLGLRSTAPPPPVRAGGVAMERPVPGADAARPAAVRPIPHLIRVRLAYQVGWTRLVPFDRAQGLPRAGICTAVVYWPDGVPAERTWAGRPAGWNHRPVRQRDLRWVVWYDPGCRAPG